jgi:hypothetical protein
LYGTVGRSPYFGGEKSRRMGRKDSRSFIGYKAPHSAPSFANREQFPKRWKKKNPSRCNAKLQLALFLCLIVNYNKTGGGSGNFTLGGKQKAVIYNSLK